MSDLWGFVLITLISVGRLSLKMWQHYLRVEKANQVLSMDTFFSLFLIFYGFYLLLQAPAVLTSLP